MQILPESHYVLAEKCDEIKSNIKLVYSEKSSLQLQVWCEDPSFCVVKFKRNENILIFFF